MNLSKYMPNKLLPISSTEISIRDEFDRELIIGETGELLIRGPQVMAGYWRQDLETQRVLTKDGWLRTGDIAMLDAQGFVHLVDRKKNVINISGFKVYPNEVETVIAAIPGISEVAVVADKNLAQNEIVKAYVVSRDSRVDERAVLKFCAQHLAAYKVPKQVIFLDNLPKSNLGKILRNELP